MSKGTFCYSVSRTLW